MINKNKKEEFEKLVVIGIAKDDLTTDTLWNWIEEYVKQEKAEAVAQERESSGEAG